jgi:hypothetical protein
MSFTPLEKVPLTKDVNQSRNNPSTSDIWIMMRISNLHPKPNPDLEFHSFTIKEANFARNPRSRKRRSENVPFCTPACREKSNLRNFPMPANSLNHD